MSKTLIFDYKTLESLITLISEAKELTRSRSIFASASITLTRLEYLKHCDSIVLDLVPLDPDTDYF